MNRSPKETEITTKVQNTVIYATVYVKRISRVGFAQHVNISEGESEHEALKDRCTRREGECRRKPLNTLIQLCLKLIQLIYFLIT